MNKTRVGFFGFGKMAQAIVQGWNLKKIDWIEVCAYAPSQQKLEKNCRKLGCAPCASLIDCAAQSDVLIVACKPAQVPDVLQEAVDDLDGKLVICLAAGMRFDAIDPLLADVSHVSIMPNTAMAVGAGIVIVERKNTMDEAQKQLFDALFEPLAMIETVSEKQFGIAGTLSGCSPAFLGLYAEALADAGVKYGLTRPVAARIAAGVVYGAGSMLARPEIEPSVFKNDICSPGGTTIKGIVTLEKDGFRKAVIEAIEAIMEPERY